MMASLIRRVWHKYSVEIVSVVVGLVVTACLFNLGYVR